MAQPNTPATPDQRPHSHEVENEMVNAPHKDGKPPRPATTPAGTDADRAGNPAKD